MSDEILAGYSNDDIAAHIREEYGSRDFAPTDDAIEYYIAALRMEPRLREEVFKLFQRAPLLCRECGRPSCLHGYSDE